MGKVTEEIVKVLKRMGKEGFYTFSTYQDLGITVGISCIKLALVLFMSFLLIFLDRFKEVLKDNLEYLLLFDECQNAGISST